MDLFKVFQGFSRLLELVVPGASARSGQERRREQLQEGVHVQAALHRLEPTAANSRQVLLEASTARRFMGT